MSRVVFIGGFGNGRGNVERVASALTAYYDDVDPFTFSRAISNPDTIRKATRNVNTVTHSAGMLALVGTSPDRIDAFDPPLPTTRLKIIGKAGFNTVRVHMPGIGIRSTKDFAAISGYDRSSIAELAVHPARNFGNLGAIARFDAVDSAIAARKNGIKVALGYMNGDKYFQLSEEREAAANAGQVNVVRLPGIHDELVIRPAETLHAYRAQSLM